MQIDGGAGGSRSHPQHSFRIEPGNGSLGDGDLKYKLMKRRPNRDNFPSFYVRNGSNQYLKLKYKDALQVTALGQNTYTHYSAYEPIVVFINGEYFGVYELREKINYDFLEDNLNMNIDSLDFLGVSYFKGQQLEALRGSIEPFLNDFERFQQFDILSETYLEDVDRFLDIKNYTDYIIAESWVANNDWPFNNIKTFRCVGTNMRWQWAINDLEWGLNPNGWTSAAFDHIEYMLNQGQWNNYTGYWYNMMQNPVYKAYFINRFADLMNTNYHFSVIGRLENEMYNEILPEMKGQYGRWGSSNINGQMNTFTNNHNTFRKELENRSNYVRQHLRSHFNLKNEVSVTLSVEPEGAGSIQISTITPNVYPWEGIYFTDVEIEITALPNPGYKFDQWANNSFIDNIYEAVHRTKHEGKFNLIGLQGTDVFGKTLGIIGLGEIGHTVLKIAKGFGMDVIVYTRTQDEDLAQEYDFRFAKDLDELLKVSDIITLHLPLNEHTKHIINCKNVTKMKKGVFLVNTARGGLIETEAILEGLKENIFGGVGLDVLENELEFQEEADLLSTHFRKKVDYENLVLDHILMTHPKVVVTPHTAFNSTEARLRILDTTFDNINAFIEGKPVNEVPTS
ncbi:MAG TPA: NAD(P)-dependent oxidoreductase [Prolixibacteraceae bacterium]|nr:NAD(P)-dependent oxidoreductase [Prolixibacteraceae bacterium]